MVVAKCVDKFIESVVVATFEHFLGNKKNYEKEVVQLKRKHFQNAQKKSGTPKMCLNDLEDWKN